MVCPLQHHLTSMSLLLPFPNTLPIKNVSVDLPQLFPMPVVATPSAKSLRGITLDKSLSKASASWCKGVPAIFFQKSTSLFSSMSQNSLNSSMDASERVAHNLWGSSIVWGTLVVLLLPMDICRDMVDKALCTNVSPTRLSKSLATCPKAIGIGWFTPGVLRMCAWVQNRNTTPKLKRSGLKGSKQRNAHMQTRNLWSFDGSRHSSPCTHLCATLQCQSLKEQWWMGAPTHLSLQPLQWIELALHSSCPRSSSPITTSLRHWELGRMMLMKLLASSHAALTSLPDHYHAFFSSPSWRFGHLSLQSRQASHATCHLNSYSNTLGLGLAAVISVARGSCVVGPTHYNGKIDVIRMGETDRGIVIVKQRRSSQPEVKAEGERQRR